MKLISMTNFVLKQNEVLKVYENHQKSPLFERCVDYANFLKQPLTLGMFVPCDVDGNVLNEPEPEYSSYNPYEDAEPSYNIVECENYKQAFSKVIFNGIEKTKIKGFDFSIGFLLFSLSDYKSIECLINNNHKVEFDLTVSF